LGAPQEQAVADALKRAVLRDGVAAGTTSDRSLEVVFEGADDREKPASPPATHAAPTWAQEVLAQVTGARGELRGNRLKVHVPFRVSDDRAPAVVAQLVQLTFDEQLDRIEPRRVPAATLARWSRPAAGAPPDAVPANEGDHRWLWSGALLLLFLEHLVRRRSLHG
jgi:hypothetical protein